MSDEIDDQQDNIANHSKEIESISSFYAKDFNKCSEEIVAESGGLKYEIWVRKDLEWSASLRFSLPDKYPSKPPVFVLHSTWMTDGDEGKLYESFGQKLKENHGVAVGLLDAWIEILREFVDKKAEKATREQENKTEILEDEVESEEEEQQVDDIEEHVESTCPKIIHGKEPITDRKSTFLAHFAVITSKHQIEQVLTELKKDRKVAKATYNIWACRIFDEEKKSYIEYCDDDGESAAGGRLLHLLQTSDANNVIVIVTRWHGKIEIGPERFKHINDCAKKILQSHGIIESKTSTDNKDTKGKAKTKTKKH